MNKFLILISLLILTTVSILQAQPKLSWGLKAGLNFSTILGENLTDEAGNSLETRKAMPGISIGPTLTIPLNDKLALLTELQFTQRGIKYRYQGDSWRIYSVSDTTFNNTIYTSGTERLAINVTNAYIEVPLIVYYKTKKWRLGLGGSLNWLVSSGGIGESVYKGNYQGSQLDSMLTTMQPNYIKDDPREASGLLIRVTTNNGTPIQPGGLYPQSVGAYYEYEQTDGYYYNRFDVGAVANLTYMLSKGLGIGVRATYGITDVTNSYYDFDRRAPQDAANSNYNKVLRNDKDHNLTIQASIGFSF
jgi:hypothetical protein